MDSSIALDGYVLDRCIRATERSVVWAGRRERDDVAVMAKRYIHRPERARREMEVMQQLRSHLVLEVLALELSNEGPVLVTKLFEGKPLSALFAEGGLPADTFLKIARQVAEALVVVHDERIIHRDLSPGNIVVNPATMDLCLIDFGLAQRFGVSSTSCEVSSVEAAGTLLYISPEQTGRMDRGIDFRSDLYSLGAVLYHLAAGCPPFDGEDALSIVHAHFAKSPPDPCTHNRRLPRTVARIVLKLLEKDPERRYQSAAALVDDLRQCEAELQASGRIPDDLRLCAADAPDRPVFASALYGCAAQVRTLCEAFSEAAAGRFRVCVIAGRAGTGKTALVEEVRKVASEARGVVALGRFESGSQRPGLGFIGALSSLAQQLLVQDESLFEAQRARIDAELGSLAGVVTEFVPEMEFVLGERPPPAVLDGDQALRRLCHAVGRLLRGCAGPETPVVLVLDDVQWMDATSVALLRYLTREIELRGLQLVLTSRTPERGEEPVAHVDELIREAGSSVCVIETGPLCRDDLEAMLCEALLTTPEATAGLIAEVATKTGSVPLLVKQFIALMAERRVLLYQHSAGWVWDESAIAAADIADDAVALMSQKIDALDPGLRRMLRCASVIGRVFDVDGLSELSGEPRPDVEGAILALCHTGLICVCDAGLRFSHDRIRTAAHDGLPEAERQALHTKMGRALLERLSEEQRGARLFEIVDHLNEGAPPEEPERVEWLDLNLRAARQAIGKGAPDAAQAYLDRAGTLLPEEGVSGDLERGLELCLMRCEAALFAAQFERSLAALEPLAGFDWDLITQARIAAWRLRVFAVTRPPEETVQHFLEVLRKFGIRWPLHPSRWRILRAQARTEWILRGRDSATLFRPPGPNPWVPVLVLTGPAGAALTRVDAGLAALASCLAISSYAEYGCISRPGFSLAAYTNFLFLYWPWPARAVRYRQMIEDWDARMPDPLYSRRAKISNRGGSDTWIDWRRKSIDPLEELAEEGIAYGDLEQSAYALFLCACLRAFVGDPVEKVRDHFSHSSASLHAGHLYSEPMACLGPYELLAGEPAPLDERVRASEAFLRANPSVSEPYVATMWMMVSCILSRPDVAHAQSERVFQDVMRVAPYVHVPDHFFYRGLSAGMLAHDARRGERRRLRRSLAQCERVLRKRAKLGPDFVHMATLLSAERAHLAGQTERARGLYRQAVEQAQRAHYVHHVALAYERAAALEGRARRFSQATRLSESARGEYQAWGATRKVALLAGS